MTHYVDHSKHSEVRSDLDDLSDKRPNTDSVQPMKIAVLIPSIQSGGAERVALSTSQGLAKRGHNVDLILFNNINSHLVETPEKMNLVQLEDSHVRGIDRSGNIAVSETNIGFLNALKVLWKRPHLLPSTKQLQRSVMLLQYLEKSKPDCIISHMHRAAEVAWLTSNMMPNPVPVLCVVHNVGSEIKTDRQRRQFWNVLSQAQRVVAVSEAVKKAVVEQSVVSKSMISVIYNGVQVKNIETLSRERPEHKWFGCAKIPIVLGVGRLVPQKDWPTLMRAFCLLRRRMKCRLLILGEGPLKQRFQDLSHQLSIEEDFDNPGYAGNPYQYMRHSAVMGLSSEFEGLGMVLLEALACGCPCVSTDIDGPQEVLADGRYGTLVPVGDHEAMANALEAAIRTPPPRDLLQRRAEEFSLERCVSKYEKLIASVVVPKNKNSYS